MFDFELTLETITQTAPFWGYPLMFLLMVIEGPFATMISAFFASQGHFNLWAVYALSISGDILGDIILYGIGRFGGYPALTKIRKRFGRNGQLQKKIEQAFVSHGAKIIFYVKISTGLAFVTFLTAGTAKMNFGKFLKFTFLGGIIWSGILVSLGYFFGYAAELIAEYLKFSGLVIFVIAILVVFLIGLFKKKIAGKILKNN